MGYILKRGTYSLEKHLTILEQKLANFPDQTDLIMLKEYVKDDRYMQAKMIVRFLSLSQAEGISLLKGFIEDEKGEANLISEAGEQKIEELADVFMEKAKAYFEDDNFIDAAATIFSIVMAIEPELPNVPYQGYIYHCILENAFDFLMQIAASDMDHSVAKHLFKMTEQNWILLNKGNRFYDESWLNLLGDLAAYSQSA
ncbi:hypothetical protein [Pedobacter nyackensis]|uniref:Uncharacterized protein n=1 Tax=Pedobacter nyackensis TaxID=475255 RepID=A0A1W2EGV8_9SPHI|nr:hypothetical protein [Pedobacter nyackensis]SMD08875.1 hypothetical protein SAMN04488101_11273 [Pedobacter nyackensis]